MTTATPPTEQVDPERANSKNDTFVTRSPAAERRSMSWRTWPDWVNIVIGVYLAFAALWTTGAPVAWFIGLGAVIAAVGFVALAAAYSLVPAWVQIAVGVVTVLAPWLGDFAAAPAAAWSVWIAGVAVIVFAVAGMSMQRRAVR